MMLPEGHIRSRDCACNPYLIREGDRLVVEGPFKIVATHPLYDDDGVFCMEIHTESSEEVA